MEGGREGGREGGMEGLTEGVNPGVGAHGMSGCIIGNRVTSYCSHKVNTHSEPISLCVARPVGQLT